MAAMTLTYIYAQSTAVLGPLATFSEPHSYDLCERHGLRLTVPNGWHVIRQEISELHAGPSHDDLIAIADAVREAAQANAQEVPAPAAGTASPGQPGIGRRGHLRAVPS